MPEPRFTPVATLDQIASDGVLPLNVAGRAVLIVRHDDRLFAVEDRCSHADQPLACGRVRWGWIACPAHGAKFDLATGEALSPPATGPIAVFALRIVGDTVEIAL